MKIALAGITLLILHPEAENTWVIGGGSNGFKLGPALESLGRLCNWQQRDRFIL